jgi:hypothetical protein
MSTKLSNEEIRAARLRALGVAPADSSSSQQVPAATTAGSAMHMSPAQETAQESSAPAGKKQALGPHTRAMEASELEALQRVMYRGGLACEEDMARWYTQGFVFCAQPCFGLRQGSGGPCGVLAAVQAELVREMLFPGDPAQEQGVGQGGAPSVERSVLPQPSELDVNSLLATAGGDSVQL